MERRPPPHDEHELRVRAQLLAGRTLGDVARALGVTLSNDAVRTKGKTGELLERALGASGGSLAAHDFPHLAIELKTIPVDERGVPRESTYVCTVALADADAAEWRTSWVRAKLSHVLWIPVVSPTGAPPEERRVGSPLFWRPTREQDEVLGADFDDLIGAIGVGGIEGLTARTGRWLQVRPKAADASARTVAYGPGGERITTVPRGFYLRARFTGAILRDEAHAP